MGGLHAQSPRAAAAAGADPATATRGHKNEAQKKFDKGASFGRNDIGSARGIRASYEIVASPNTHFSIGRALAAMGQLAEAYVEFGKTMTEAEAGPRKTSATSRRRTQPRSNSATCVRSSRFSCCPSSTRTAPQ